MKVKILSEYATLPTRGSLDAAGYDLYAAIPDETNIGIVRGQIEIPPHETRLIPTGIAIDIGNGFWGGIYARSGLATKQGLRPANCVGVIDSDYRGEIMVALHNDTNESRYVYCGDRIAQLVFHQTASLVPDENGEIWQVVDELSETDRGNGGFGSTGI